MTNEKLDVDQLLEFAEANPSKWFIDTIVYGDRTTNPKTLVEFLSRIKHLRSMTVYSTADKAELTILEELAKELDANDCKLLLSGDDELTQQQYLENLARQGALETLCNNQLSIDTMVNMCKLSPNDFILAAKRSQDIINAIRELVIQGETLSTDVAGA
jgi:hypothetical protein